MGPVLCLPGWSLLCLGSSLVYFEVTCPYGGLWGQRLQEVSLEFSLLVSIRPGFQWSILEGLGVGLSVRPAARKAQRGLEGQGGVGMGWAPFAPRYTGAGQSRWAHGDQSLYTPRSGTGVRPVSQTGVRKKGEGHRVAVRTSWLQEGFVEALTKLTLDGCQLHSTDVLRAVNTGRARRDQGAALCALSGCSPAVWPPDSQTVRPG